MLLGVDIGNTRISFALIRDKEVACVKSCQTADIKAAASIIVSFSVRGVKECVVCSVVPSANKRIMGLIRKNLGVKAKIVGRDIKVLIKNNYRNPHQVGQDRLLCSFAAKEIYGYPAIVIDFGTAITFDIVSKEGSYEGGMIIPGIRLSLESLHNKTALLPKIEYIKVPKKLIGKETKESILSGIFNGYGKMSEGLVELLSKELGGKAKVILTGGYSDLMARYIKGRCIVDKDLIFKGMGLLFNK
ncbi:MAG: type III pantothenate kinase, partial [Candidatus Omnitrophica bacterium]|nr:type III pantothenate kinase [Candidatus Omnitrophota bacterium]